MSSDRVEPAQLAPIALTAAQVGELLGIDASTVRRNAAAGVMPEPVKVGAAVRYRRAEIEAWLAAGCPHADGWDYQDVESTRTLRVADG